jgi:hypothetical protein
MGNLISKLKRRVRNYRVGMLGSEAKHFILHTAKEIITRPDTGYITLKPAKAILGDVLLCYENKGFFTKPEEHVPNDHTNRCEAVQIAQTFLDLGYRVDVIGENNESFVPAKQYSIFVGNRINFDRITESLNPDCLKILHIDTAHWLFHNTAEHRRFLQLQQRRQFTLPKRRSLKPNLAIEHADCATILGNEFTMGTYRYANKPLYRMSISTPTLYPWAEGKDFNSSRRHFLWFGGWGFIHKGLDLVLEAFVGMPDLHLTVCGPIEEEQDFKQAFSKELYETPNIHTEGWVSIDSRKFDEICRRSIALIYPSCSEGQCGGVVTCMHAGLIPIVSYESGIDVSETFGVVLKESSIQEIQNAARKIASLSARELQLMARAAWDFARVTHTREKFSEQYRKNIAEILGQYSTDKIRQETPHRRNTEYTEGTAKRKALSA